MSTMFAKALQLGLDFPTFCAAFTSSDRAVRLRARVRLLVDELGYDTARSTKELELYVWHLIRYVRETCDYAEQHGLSLGEAHERRYKERNHDECEV
jgi:hypothetical protein